MPPTVERVQVIPVKKVFQNPYQPRRMFPANELDQLKKSIREYGVLVPIVVRTVDRGFELACGERRLRSCRALEMKTIPAIVRSLSTPQLVELALLENLHRRDLAILEEAEAFERLKQEFDVHTDSQLADRLGLPEDQVKKYGRLARLPMLLKKALLEDLITEQHAFILSGLDGREQVRKWLTAVIHQKLSPTDLQRQLSA